MSWKSGRCIALLGGLALLHVAPAGHAAQGCHGVIRYVLTEAKGSVHVLPSFRNDWLQVCNLNSVWKGVTVDVCKSWVGTATALRLTQETAIMYYAEDTPCISIPTYSLAPAPGYIAISNPGG